VKRQVFKYSTEIPVDRSLGGITSMLAAAGATSINQDYADGKPVAIRFSLPIGQRVEWFNLPCRIEAVERSLAAGEGPRSRRSAADRRAQAERVAWRQLYAWIEAQLAMISTDMVTTDEVFFPYLMNGPSGATMFQAFQSARKLLPEGKAK
jgi:hypothetical protein